MLQVHMHMAQTYGQCLNLGTTLIIRHSPSRFKKGRQDRPSPNFQLPPCSFHFTIHGLWPNYKSGGWPEFCDSHLPFDESKIADIQDDLEEEWPSFMGGGDDPGFWKHEWEKHGTCALDVMPDEHAYFKTALGLHYKYNIEVRRRRAWLGGMEGGNRPARGQRERSSS